MRVKKRKSVGRRRRSLWITAAKYSLGILTLTASVAVAMYFPQWYGAWQDRQMIGQIELSSREHIEFIDTASLDHAGRMQLISQAEEIAIESYDGYSSSILQNPEKYLENCKKQVELFGESGLIPEYYVNLVKDDFCETVTSPIVILENSRVLQVNCALFRSWEAPDERLIILTDAETDFVYYISFSGAESAKEVQRRFGKESWDLVEYAAEEGLGLEIEANILKEWKIQELCSAKEVNTYPTANFGYTEFDLVYENFQAKGYHYLIIGESGPGFALVFGMKNWHDLVTEELIRYGYVPDEIILEYDGEVEEAASKKEDMYSQQYDMAKDME